MFNKFLKVRKLKLLSSYEINPSVSFRLKIENSEPEQKFLNELNINITEV
jgi:hypothetical protein